MTFTPTNNDLRATAKGQHPSDYDDRRKKELVRQQDEAFAERREQWLSDPPRRGRRPGPNSLVPRAERNRVTCQIEGEYLKVRMGGKQKHAVENRELLKLSSLLPHLRTMSAERWFTREAMLEVLALADKAQIARRAERQQLKAQTT